MKLSLYANAEGVEEGGADQPARHAQGEQAEDEPQAPAGTRVRAGRRPREDAVAGLLKDFLQQAQQEPGVKEFQIHRNISKPREFFFYEVFAGEAAFADHQQTAHFKNIIVGQAVPRLAKRERSQFRFI